jgi:probable HAF family extracellular repeat protein
MIDLGVLEGEDPFALSTGYGINQAAQVVGVSGNSAFLWSRSRDFQQLGIGFAEALDINERGQVTGHRDFGCPGVAMGFIWHHGVSEDLGTLYQPQSSPCEAGSTGRAVNNRGQVVGWSETAPFNPPAWNQHGFMWDDGEMTDLGSLGVWSEAWGVNGRGQIVGYTDSPDGAQACMWEGEYTEPQPLFLDPPDWSIAVAINNAGTVVGWSTTPAGPQHAYRWRDGLMEDLGALGGGYPQSWAKAINNRGMIVGVSVQMPHVSDFIGRATMWEPGASPIQAIDLGTLPGGAYSSAFAVNNHGVIAGWSDTGTGEFHAVLWIP